MSMKHLAATASADEVAAALAQDGAAIIDKLVTPEAMDNVAERIAAVDRCDSIRSRRFRGPAHQAHRRTGGALASDAATW